MKYLIIVDTASSGFDHTNLRTHIESCGAKVTEISEESGEIIFGFDDSI